MRAWPYTPVITFACIVLVIAAAAAGRIAFRHAVATRLIPALRAYGPTLLMLSAGFDGALKDQVIDRTCMTQIGIHF